MYSALWCFANPHAYVFSHLSMVRHKRVKGRSHTAEGRTSMHSHRPHATRQPSLFSLTHSITAQLAQPPLDVVTKERKGGATAWKNKSAHPRKVPDNATYVHPHRTTNIATRLTSHASPHIATRLTSHPCHVVTSTLALQNQNRNAGLAHAR